MFFGGSERLGGRPNDADQVTLTAAPEGLSETTTPRGVARDVIAYEESLPGDKVRMTFRAVLSRRQAEALAARAIREEKNLVALMTEILKPAPTKGTT